MDLSLRPLLLIARINSNIFTYMVDRAIQRPNDNTIAITATPLLEHPTKIL